MRLNVFKRSLVFATFFGACACVALISTSLLTSHWVEARAHRTMNPNESDGRVHFGLFDGHKELNYGYGWRSSDFGVKAGTHPARRWAWCGAALLLGSAAAAAGLAGLLAACAAATGSRCSPCPLLISNTFTVLLTFAALAVWLTEFLLRLQHNVMSDQDLANTWTSDGTSDLGYSFWLVVGACVMAIVNDVCIVIAIADNRDSENAAPALEEKVNGAIMLY